MTALVPWAVTVATGVAILAAIVLLVYGQATLQALAKRRSHPLWPGIAVLAMTSGTLTFGIRWLVHHPRAIAPSFGDGWLDLLAWSLVALALTYLFESLFASRPPAHSARESSSSLDSSRWHYDTPYLIPLAREISQRVRAESSDRDPLIGRARQVSLLASRIRSQSSGSILITGPRGVGKTTLVDRAIIQARNELRAEAPPQIRRPWLWQLAGIWSGGSNDNSGEPLLVLRLTVADLAVQTATAAVVKRSRRAAAARTGKKTSASHQVTASIDHDAQAAAREADARSELRLTPEPVLRAMVRKLYAECHASRRTAQATRIQRLMRRDERATFLQLLETTYNRAASRSLKSRLHQSREDAASGKLTVSGEQTDIVRLIAGYGPAAVFAGAAWAASAMEWRWLVPIFSTASLSLAAITSWPALKLAWRWQLKSERSRKAEESYEFEYGSTQIADDLQRLFRILAPPGGTGPFTRIVFVFDELDKLQRPLESLSPVLHHFKNLYTLSDALFIFVTDDLFYRQWQQSLRTALHVLQYAPEHTYFTQVIYLRKPDFDELRAFIYHLFDDDDMKTLAKQRGDDRELVAYLLDTPPNSAFTNSDDVESLTGIRSDQLWVELWKRRADIDERRRSRILSGLDLMARGQPRQFAASWIRMASWGAPEEIESFADSYEWSNAPGVALLYAHVEHFPAALQKRIRAAHQSLGRSSLTWMATAELTFTDFARYLIFQSKAHYFDLQQLLYSYLHALPGGRSALEFDPNTPDSQKFVKSRFQEMVEMVYESFRHDESGEDFYNQILIESLYRVFESYGDATPATIGSVRVDHSLLFLGAVDQQAGMPQRWYDEINHALERLLQLLYARGAVAFDPPVPPPLRIEPAATHRIVWTGTCDAIVSRSGVPLMADEHALIEFWRAQRLTYLAMEQGLADIWIGVSRGEKWQWPYHTRRLHDAVQALVVAGEPLDRGIGIVSRSQMRRLLVGSPLAADLIEAIPTLFGERAAVEAGTSFLDGHKLDIEEFLKKQKSAVHADLRRVSSTYFMSAGDGIHPVATFFVERLTPQLARVAQEVADSYDIDFILAARLVDQQALGEVSPSRVIGYDDGDGLSRVFALFQERIGRARAQKVLSSTEQTPEGMAAAVADLFGSITASHPWIIWLRNGQLDALADDVERHLSDPDAPWGDPAIDAVIQIAAGSTDAGAATSQLQRILEEASRQPAQSMPSVSQWLVMETVKLFVVARLPVPASQSPQLDQALKAWASVVTDFVVRQTPAGGAFSPASSIASAVSSRRLAGLEALRVERIRAYFADPLKMKGAESTAGAS